MGKTKKKIVAYFLSGLLAVGCFSYGEFRMTAYAEGADIATSTDAEEITEETVEEESGENKGEETDEITEDKSDEISEESAEDTTEEITEDATEEITEEEITEEKSITFNQTQIVDGVSVTVTAEEGVFPEGAFLSVRSANDTEQSMVEQAVEQERDEAKNVAVSYTYDIKVFDAYGNEIQPDTKKGEVKVSFGLAEASNVNLDADIYHVSDEETSVLTAEKLNTENEGLAVAAETDGFSYYTVEFTYDEKQYTMEGDSEVALSDILDKVGIIGTVTNAYGSNDTLFSAENRDGVWYIIAHEAFTSHEWLKVTVDGVEYEIVVTDATQLTWNTSKWTTTSNTSKVYLDESTGVLTIKAGTLPEIKSGTSIGYDDWPWGDKKYLVKKVVFESGVVAGTSIEYMFSWCSQLTTVDFRNLDTSKTTNMVELFQHCTALESVTFGGKFTTSNVTEMIYMFSSTNKLRENKSLDLSTFDTSKVTKMNGMLYLSGVKADSIKNFNTSKVTDMSQMFYGCAFDKGEIDVSNYNFSKVTDASRMFYYCTDATKINLGAISSTSMTSCYSMFEGDSNLVTIVSTNLNSSTITSSGNMFKGCTKLKGGNGTTFDSSNLDKTYARIDGTPTTSTKGYFTAPHNHVWSLTTSTSSPHIATLKCTASGCSYTTNKAYTASFPSATWADKTYTGSKIAPTVSKTSGFPSEATVSAVTVYSYTNNVKGSAVSNPVNVGKYIAEATVKVGSTTKTITCIYSIVKANSGASKTPSAKTGLIYNGSAQTLANAGTATNGTMQYRLGEDGTWSSTIPTATDADTYKVYWRVKGNSNYNDYYGSGSESNPPYVETTIATKTMTKNVTGVNATYDGTAKQIAVTATDPQEDYEVTYKGPGDSDYSETNPSFKDAGEYTVQYKITKTNYTTATGEAVVKISPKQVTVTPTANQKKIYGKNDPVFTYSAEGLVGSETLAGSLARSGGENAGAYDFQIGTLDSANANYNVKLADSIPKFTIDPKSVADDDVIATLVKDSFLYDSTNKVPIISSVTYGDKVLAASTDYSIISTSDIEASDISDDYVLEIQGQGNYTGTKDISWSIKRPDAVVTDADSNMHAYASLKDALASTATSEGEDTVTLLRDVSLTDNTTIPVGTTLNLGGHNLETQQGKNLNNKGVLTDTGVDIEGNKGTGTVAGTVVNEGNIEDTTVTGNIINSGDISGTIVTGGVTNSGDIADTKVTGDVTNEETGTVTGTEIEGEVTNSGAITDTKVTGDVTNEETGAVTGTEIEGEVTNSGAITDTKVTGDVTNEEKGTVTGTEIEGEVTNNGNMEDVTVTGDVTNSGDISDAKVTGDVTNEETGTVTGTEIEGEVTNNGNMEDVTVTGDVTNSGDISDTKVTGDVTNEETGTVTGTEIEGEVTNSGDISDTKVTGDVTNEETGSVTGTEIEGDITNSGEIADTKVTGDVTNEETGSVTGTEIEGEVTNSGDISDAKVTGDVTNEETGAVTGTEIEGEVTNSGAITDTKVTGDVTNEETGSVTGTEIEGEVTNSGAIADSNVTGDVTNEETGAVTGTEIEGDITNSGAITDTKVTGDVTNEETGTVTGTEIEGEVTNSGAITDTKVTGDVTNEETGAVTGTEIEGEVTNNGSMEDVTVTGDVTNSGDVDGANITGNVENSGDIADAKVEGEVINEGTISGSEITGVTINKEDGVITESKLVGETNNAGAINSTYIEGEVENTGTVTDQKVEDGKGGKDNYHIELGNGAPETKLENVGEELLTGLLSVNEMIKFKAGMDVDIYLIADSADNTVTDTEKTGVEGILEKYEVVGTFLDITLLKKVGNAEPVKITETGTKLKITVKVSKEIIDKAVSGSLRVVRYHNGVAEVLPSEFNEADSTITFETDKFSIYAITYKDKESVEKDKTVPRAKVENPKNGTAKSKQSKSQSSKTGDNTRIAIAFMLMIDTLMAAVYLTLYKRKKNNK